MTHPVIELYPTTVRDEAPASDTKRADYMRLAKKFNLNQLNSGDTLVRDECKSWCNRHGLKPLSDEELKVWREYLPTSYWSNTHKARRNSADEILQHFSSYAFHEGVPLIVLQRMEMIADKFDVLEIRTPEQPLRMTYDPVLWGHVIHPDGSRIIYPLARWAESDANFIEGVADVKKILLARRGVLFPDTMTSTSAILGSLVGLSVLGAFFTGCLMFVLSFLSSDAPYGRYAFLAGGIAGLGFAVTNYASHLIRLRRLRKENPQLARFV